MRYTIQLESRVMSPLQGTPWEKYHVRVSVDAPNHSTANASLERVLQRLLDDQAAEERRNLQPVLAPAVPPAPLVDNTEIQAVVAPSHRTSA